MISRRGLIAGSAGMPLTGRGGQTPRRPDQAYSPPAGVVIAPGNKNVVRARTVIVFGTGNGVGFFEYNGRPAGPVPGPANPPVAYAAPPGVTQDPFGNTLPATTGGFTAVRTALGFYAQLAAGALVFNTPASVVAPGAVQLNGSTNLQLLSPVQNAGGHTAMLELLSESTVSQVLIADFPQGGTPPTPVTTAQLEVRGNIAVALIQAIVASALETWHVVGAAGQPPFVNSFTAGGTAPRFQLEPINGGRVRLSGAVNTGAVTAASTTMFTLPAGYVPSRLLQFVTPNNVTAYALGNASVQVTTGGAVQLVPAGTAGKFVLLDGICFELD